MKKFAEFSDCTTCFFLSNGKAECKPRSKQNLEHLRAFLCLLISDAAERRRYKKKRRQLVAAFS
jgi:hypothetical protein